MVSRFTLIFFICVQLAFGRWGWGTHRFINNAAVDRLPAAMSFFQDHRDYLTEHSVDPDQSWDPNPGFYHYIDIDVFDEFFDGTLPHSYAGMIAMYGLNAVQDAGVVPWVIEWWLADLTTLMEAGNWDQAWQVAAELGHYVADSHQAFHLTENYNGQMTGNYGIHSRYETELMNRHLDTIDLPDSTGSYWGNPIDSIMAYIEDIYPVVALVLTADDQAYAVDPNHGTTYYNMMWTAVGDTTVWTVNRAAVDLASLWYTAWINAGSPYPAGVGVNEHQLPERLQLHTFPNPFNGTLTLSYSLEHSGQTGLTIYDLQGRKVRELALGWQTAGDHGLTWDGRDQSGQNLSTGSYLVQLETEGQHLLNKITLVK